MTKSIENVLKFITPDEYRTFYDKFDDETNNLVPVHSISIRKKKELKPLPARCLEQIAA